MLETYSILPFLIGLFFSLHFKNIYFFAYILVLKEYILLNYRIIELRTFILNHKILILQILFFSTLFIFIVTENYNLVFLNVIILLILSFINIPFNLLKNEFSKK